MSITEYVTSRGVKIKVLGIQSLWEKFQAAERMPKIPDELQKILGDAVVKPDAPTYDVKTITGAIEHHMHNQTTLRSDEERAAWEQYQAALEVYEKDRVKRQKYIMCLYAIDCDMPADDAWAERLKKLFDADVPTDPDDRKVYYIEHLVLGGEADVMRVMMLSQVAGLPEEVRQQAEALFRREMERYTAERFASTHVGLDNESAISASESSIDGRIVAAEQV